MQHFMSLRLSDSRPFVNLDSYVCTLVYDDDDTITDAGKGAVVNCNVSDLLVCVPDLPLIQKSAS